MRNHHTKNHRTWSDQKTYLDKQDVRAPYFHEREVWFCAIGHNIGTEIDGKGAQYSRPVLILKRAHRHLLIGIPLTTKQKPGVFRKSIGIVNQRPAIAILAHVRSYSSKRLIRKIDVISRDIFTSIKKAIEAEILQ